MVANRLSEIKHWRILLLEAGPDENEISDVSNVKIFPSIDKNMKKKYFIVQGSIACRLLTTKQIRLGL